MPLADPPTSGPSAVAPTGTHGAVCAPMPSPLEGEGSGCPVVYGKGLRETLLTARPSFPPLELGP